MELQFDHQNENPVQSKRDSKAERVTPDFPIIKVQLPKEAALKVQGALQTLKERKADVKADDLLADFLESLSEVYLEGEIEKRTPEDYYFEAAKNIPELREKMILQVKKALQKTDKTQFSVAPSEAPRKTKKKEKPSEILPEAEFQPLDAPLVHFSQADFTQ